MTAAKGRLSAVFFIAVILLICAFILCVNLTQAKADIVTQINVPMDETDPAKSIQKMLDMAKINATPDNIYKLIIPPGKYTLGTQLKIYSNTHLYMKGVTLINGTPKQNMVRFGRVEDGNHAAYNGFENITLEGGTWEGNKNEALLHFSHAQNIVIKDIIFQNVMNSHHMEFVACKNVQITGCAFYNYYGINSTSFNQEAIQIDVAHTPDHFSDGVYDDTPCDNILIQGNVFRNVQRGVGAHTAVAGSYHTNIKIINNTFDQISGYAIMATNFRKATITGNTVTNAAAGIMFRTMVQGNENFYTPNNKRTPVIVADAASVIANNKITVIKNSYTNTSYGISLYGENLAKRVKDVPKGDYRINNVTIKGNSIYMKDSGYGIWLQGARKCMLDGNKITVKITSAADGKGNGDGIRLVGSTGNTISGNTIKHTAFCTKSEKACGIVITDKSSAAIAKNKIYDSNKDAIFVTNGSIVTAKENTISKPRRYGIHSSQKSTVTAKKGRNVFISLELARQLKATAGGVIK